MSHYENVPFDVPKGWCWCSVGDIVYDLKYGTSKKSSESGIVPVLRMGNLTRKGTISYDNLVYSSDSSDIEEYELSTGDLLFNRTNSSEWVGKTALYDGKVKSIYAGYLIRVRTIIINSEYLNIVMNSQYYRNWCYSVKTDAVNQSNINANKLASLRVPIPPILEQKRIVHEVTKMTEYIEVIEKGESDLQSIIGNVKSKILELAIHGKLVPQDANDEPASELLKRINPKAVSSCDNSHYAKPYELPNGWTWCKLIDICTFLSRGKSPKYSETDTTYPVFAQKCNLKEGGISLEKAQFLEPTTLNRWPDVYHLQTGDVLVNSTGTGTVGRTRLFNESCLGNYPFVVPDSHVSVIRTHGDIVPEYIFALMSSSWIQTYLEDNLAGSTNQKELYIGVLQNVDVPLPPVMEQKRIADKIESLYQQLENLANNIE